MLISLPVCSYKSKLLCFFLHNIPLHPPHHNSSTAMKVLVLGATGFIGFPAAQALARAGHIVYGLARTEEKAKLLAAEEVIPILGDLDSDAWIPLIATLDTILETVGGGPEPARAVLERTTKAAAALRPAGAPLLSYIYTSGTWVHGDNRTDRVTDTLPHRAPRGDRRVAARGRAARRRGAGGVAWDARGRYAVVHTDDLAELFVRTESVNELLDRLVQISGVNGPYEYRKPENLLEEATQSTTLVRPYLAKALLDWSPKKPGLVRDWMFTTPLGELLQREEIIQSSRQPLVTIFNKHTDKDSDEPRV
ncbi:NAD(P)-binding protein [Mycena olivaceomarginata]|nr:NAD(P)-binding protein [Mycena olivaceomarginata]